MKSKSSQPGPLTGDELVRALAALSNPHRLRILAALRGGRVHVSQLARDVGLSRPLVHVHLQRLEAAGLVSGHLELSEEGKAMKFFEVNPFSLSLTPDRIVEAAQTLGTEEKKEKEQWPGQLRTGRKPASPSRGSPS